MHLLLKAIAAEARAAKEQQYMIVRRNTRRHKHSKPYMLTRTYETLDAALLAALELSMSGLRFEYRIVGM